MSTKFSGFLSVDEQGRVILPPEVAARLHLQPGQRLPYSEEEGGLRLLPAEDALLRVNIEPTSICNFDCRTCMRNAWDEPPGRMSAAVFERVLAGLAAFSPLPLVFFGGYGEPLVHPQIFEMIARVKALGARVEMITNASLLDDANARRLVASGLDRLWVSIDGASPESYADVRLGEALPRVIENLERLRQMRAEACQPNPRLGIAFVAMKRNIHELPAVIRLGRRLGADRFSISNVLAHTPELSEEVLYGRSYYEIDQSASEWAPRIDLPRMEINDLTGPALAEALRGRASLSIAGQVLRQGANACPFIEKRSLSIRWDGEVSPCLPLMHAHTHYLDRTERKVQAVSFGSLLDRPLDAIWQSEKYIALRERLLAFDFSPCVFCSSCENAESNIEDCFGSPTPTCGGCLWAQGFILCP